VGEAARRRQAMAVRHAALVILFAAPAPLSRPHETVNLFDVDKGAADVEERAELVEPEPPAALFNLSNEITARMAVWEAVEPSSCRFPCGDPRVGKSFRFCGEARDGKRPYCSACSELAYRPAVAPCAAAEPWEKPPRARVSALLLRRFHA
jgi:hypothetical protein